MAELLSMAMLSTEPVSTAKPQSVSQGSAELADADQSFAATLAAEVNGKTTDKAEKSTAKGRQNTATDAEKANESEHEKPQAKVQSKAEHASAGTSEATALSDDEEAEAAAMQTVQEPIEQSHWLTLLDKAKSLHERLTKAAKSDPDQQLSSKVSADKTTTPESLTADDTPIVEQVIIELEQAKTTQTAALSVARQTEKAAQVVSDAKGQIAVPEALTTQSTKSQALSAEELKALKVVSQTLPPSAVAKGGKSEEFAAEKVEVSVAGLSPEIAKQATQPATQPAAQPAAQSAAKPAAQPATQQQAILYTKQQTEPQVVLQTKQQSSEQQITPDSTATLPESIESTPLPAALKTMQSQGDIPVKTVVYSERQLKVSESLKQAEIQQSTDASDDHEAIPVKSLVQAEQVVSVLKTVVPTATVKTVDPVVAEEKFDAEMPAVSGLEPKQTVQAQSAAVLVAPAVQQTKPQTTEPKASTEDVLKQAQSATVSGQSEQGGSSSSSGESQHQAGAETLLAATEQQKSSPALSAETNSFSSQLKNSLEKTASGITVSGRELMSEQNQKQVDQLGQKLNLIQPEASNQLKERMLMMVKDKVHTAEIRLDPSELGSMQIKINLQQDQMSVQFMVQQGNAKELMEQQMPKLKELLQQQGIELSQGSVQQQSQSSSGQQGGRRTAGGNGRGVAADSSEELAGSAVLPAKNSDRVVDYYA